MTIHPDPSDFLTVNDVESCPNGTATVYKVADPTYSRTALATIDGKGFLRELTPNRRYFPGDWRVCEVMQ